MKEKRFIMNQMDIIQLMESKKYHLSQSQLLLVVIIFIQYIKEANKLDAIGIGYNELVGGVCAAGCRDVFRVIFAASSKDIFGERIEQKCGDKKGDARTRSGEKDGGYRRYDGRK
eukprot:44141_1